MDSAARVDPTHLAELVGTSAARVPEHPAIVDVTGSITLTWAQLDAAGAAEEARPRTHGVGPGDRVAVRLPNGAACCVALLGALRAGAVAVPCGPAAPGRELSPALADCRPVVLVAAADDDVAVGAASVGRLELLDPPDPTAWVDAAPPLPEGGERVALCLHLRQHREPPWGATLAPRGAGQPGPDRRPAAGPDHPGGPGAAGPAAIPRLRSRGGIPAVCWVGATVVLTGRLAPDALAKVIVEQRVSTVAGVPATFRSLLELPAERLRAATADLRLCTSGGAPLPPRHLEEFRSITGLSIVEGYGLTEAGPVVTSNSIAGTPKPGSVGRALPGIELRLADEIPDEGDEPDPNLDDDDVVGGPDTGGDTGLVVIRGRNLFSGYWPDGAGGPDTDGWFRTADVGFLDADGDLHLVDRSSDSAIVNGFTCIRERLSRCCSSCPRWPRRRPSV